LDLAATATRRGSPHHLDRLADHIAATSGFDLHMVKPLNFDDLETAIGNFRLLAERPGR
jgi:hypothetical protein